MTKKLERFERFFQCERCKHKFVANVSLDDAFNIKCPRSCPSKVTDITELTVEALEVRRQEIERKIEAREQKIQAEIAANREALKVDAGKRAKIQKRR